MATSAHAIGPVAGGPCTQLWSSTLDDVTGNPLICMPVNPNNYDLLQFKIDSSQYPPSLDAPGATAFGRTCPSSLGVKTSDLHGNVVECKVVQGNQIWYSDAIANSILTGTPIPKPKPAPSPIQSQVASPDPTPSPEPEISPTVAPLPVEEELISQQPEVTRKAVEILKVSAGAIALAMGSHAVAASTPTPGGDSSAPREPRSPRDLITTEVENRRRRKSETFAEVSLGGFLSNLRKFFLAVAKRSILAYEILSDGNYLRVRSVWWTRFLYFIAISYGVFLSAHTSGKILPHEFGLIGLVALGLIDATAGVFSVLTYLITQFVTEGSNINFTKELLILFLMMAVVPNFVGSAIRPMDRDKEFDNSKEGFLWNKTTDVALTSMVSAWVGHQVITGIEFIGGGDGPVETWIVMSIFLAVALLRHLIQYKTISNPVLKERRRQLEVSSEEIGEPSPLIRLSSLLLRVVVTNLILLKILEVGKIPAENSTWLGTFALSFSVSLVLAFSEIVKFFSGGPSKRSDRLGFLNIQSPTKLFLIIALDLSFKLLWRDGKTPESGAAIVMFALVGMITFFGVTEAFVKRKPNQNDWHTKPPYKYLYYLISVAFLGVLVAYSFDLIKIG